MISLSTASIALSGMSLTSSQLAVSSDNVARRNVPGSEKNEIMPVADRNGGVSISIRKIDGDVNANSSSYEFDSSNIDYAEEAVDQKIARTLFQANYRVFEVDDAFAEDLLDMTV